MLVALIVVSAALLVVVAAFVSLLRTQQHAASRERDLLVNQILHLSGRTWSPPPSENWRPPADGEPLVRLWTATPEQSPLEV